MTPIQGRSRSHRELPSVAFLDSSLPPKLVEKLSNQPTRPPGTNFSIANIPTITFSIPKYTKKDLQQTLKTIGEI